MGNIHIAGFPVRIGALYRQRCAWCEIVLIDGDASREMVSAGSKPGASFFEIGALVEVTFGGVGAQQCVVVAHEDGSQLPANACVGPPKLRLVSKLGPLSTPSHCGRFGRGCGVHQDGGTCVCTCEKCANRD